MSRPEEFVAVSSCDVTKRDFELGVVNGLQDERSKVGKPVRFVRLQVGQVSEAANERRFGTGLPQVLAPGRVVDPASRLGADRFDLFAREVELLRDLFVVELLVGVEREDEPVALVQPLESS